MLRTSMFARRVRLRPDSGFTLIEALVALGIAVIVLLALLGTISGLTATQVANRTRSAATTVGSEMVERARALTFTSLAVLDDGTVPNTKVVNGTTYNVVKGTPCAGCLPYKQTVTVRGTAYQVTQLVLERGSYTNADGNPVKIKQVVVDVTWSNPRPGRYSIQTIVNDTTALPAANIQGIRVEAQDETGAVIEDDSVSFDVSVTGAASLTGLTEDGAWLNANLPVGSYTCVVSTNANSADYYLTGQPGVRTTSQPCNVTANAVTVAPTRWTLSPTCQTGSGTGGLTVRVEDSVAAPLSGASVTLTRLLDGAAISPALTSGSDGAAAFTGLGNGAYEYSVSKSGYTGPVTGSACVHAGLVGTASVAMATAPAPAPSPSASATSAPAPTTARLEVTIVSKQAGSKDYAIRLDGPGGSVQTKTVNVPSGCTRVTVFADQALGTYTVAVFDGTNKKTEWKNQSFSTAGTTYGLSWTTDGKAKTCAA